MFAMTKLLDNIRLLLWLLVEDFEKDRDTLWDRTFGVEPISWIPQGPSLYFTAPKIYDTRFFTIPTNWDDIPDGTVGIDFNQLVKVDVSQCGGGTKEFKSKLLRFTIKKINDTSIEFKVVED